MAQTAVKLLIKPSLDCLFHPDSYGYRLGKSAKQAVESTRRRCWNINWVVEFDIKGAFDHIDHELLLKEVKGFQMHFTPISSSWMNMVERFFRDITVYLRDGSLSSVRELESLITTFLALRNAQPTRYVWNAKGEDILNKIQRDREAMASRHKRSQL